MKNGNVLRGSSRKAAWSTNKYSVWNIFRKGQHGHGDKHRDCTGHCIRRAVHADEAVIMVPNAGVLIEQGRWRFPLPHYPNFHRWVNHISVTFITANGRYTTTTTTN